MADIVLVNLETTNTSAAMTPEYLQLRGRENICTTETVYTIYLDVPMYIWGDCDVNKTFQLHSCILWVHKRNVMQKNLFYCWMPFK